MTSPLFTHSQLKTATEHLANLVDADSTIHSPIQLIVTGDYITTTHFRSRDEAVTGLTFMNVDLSAETLRLLSLYTKTVAHELKIPFDWCCPRLRHFSSSPTTPIASSAVSPSSTSSLAHLLHDTSNTPALSSNHSSHTSTSIQSPLTSSSSSQMTVVRDDEEDMALVHSSLDQAYYIYVSPGSKLQLLASDFYFELVMSLELLSNILLSPNSNMSSSNTMTHSPRPGSNQDRSDHDNTGLTHRDSSPPLDPLRNLDSNSTTSTISPTSTSSTSINSSATTSQMLDRSMYWHISDAVQYSNQIFRFTSGQVSQTELQDRYQNRMSRIDQKVIHLVNEEGRAIYGRTAIALD